VSCYFLLFLRVQMEECKALDCCLCVGPLHKIGLCASLALIDQSFI
jgi:hypothetical protein